ncbi:MAG: glycosyltransferase family 2 protein [Bacteroidetes bacterium]|nr:glycosyltransferase family 2 protein [Bacteroidota bacterium]MBS1739819.1 glycosyltransferase family 2 protein [Bacteroidota bacterium]
MTVSIIMCAYNVSEFIDRAIQSILAQTHQQWELIICDDASTDDTVSKIKPYLTDNRIHLYVQPQNIGYLKNKNHAFTLYTGDLFTQLDADDTCPPNRLEKQVEIFLKHPEIKICGSNFQQIDLNDRPLESIAYKEDFIISKIQDNYPFWFPGLMFRPELIREFGLFSEYFTGIFGDDNYWTVRVNRKYPIYFIKDVLYNYRINPNSLTNVFNNPRKLIVMEIVQKLIDQQRNTGTDWLEQNQEQEMRSFEQQLLNNKKLMAEKYRLWCAKAIDKNDLKQAKSLLDLSFNLQRTNPATLKTAFYYLRRKLFN